jgi:tetratricopeptide (TPR) repeat protein
VVNLARYLLFGLLLGISGDRAPSWCASLLSPPVRNGPRAGFQAAAASCAASATRAVAVNDAITAARAFTILGDFTAARKALAPFETWEHPAVLATLGYLDAREGRKTDAVARYRRGLALCRCWRTPWRDALALQLASELIHLSEYNEAVQQLDWLLSKPSLLSSAGTEGQAHALLVRALFRFGDLPAAERALERWRAAPQAKSEAGTFELITEGQLRLELGQLKAAAEILDQARGQANREHNWTYESSAKANLAALALKEGAWSQARQLVTEANTASGELGAEGRRDLCIIDGSAAREMGDLAVAQRQLELAASLPATPMTSWRIQLELGRVLERLGDQAAARAALERSIADIETQRQQMEKGALQDWLMDSRRAPYEALFASYASDAAADRALAVLERFLSYRLVEDVAAASAAQPGRPLEAIARGAALLDLAGAEARLPRLSYAGKRGSVVAFVVAGGRVWRLLLAGGHAAVSPLAISPAELCGQARRFAEDPDDEQLATLLGAALLSEGALSQLGLRFSVVAPLCVPNLPVSALLVGGERLVQSRVVTLSPSVTTALSVDALPGTAAGGVLVFGDPNGDLPAAREEAVEVGRRLGEAPLLGQQASQKRFLEASAVGLLHVAAHTRMEGTGPVLVLADGPLKVSDVVRLRPAPRLVVLASCHSGAQGASSPQETLATAFLRAGSHSVLATFKSVEDAFAARVILDFYNAGGAHDPARALAQVQRMLSRTEPPSRWAAFYVAGSPEPLDSPRVISRRAISGL